MRTEQCQHSAAGSENIPYCQSIVTSPSHRSFKYKRENMSSILLWYTNNTLRSRRILEAQSHIDVGVGGERVE